MYLITVNWSLYPRHLCPSREAMNRVPLKAWGLKRVPLVGDSAPASLGDQSTTEQLPEGQKIREFLHQNRKNEAVALIMEQIAICAGKKQFDLAEKLRGSAGYFERRSCL
jgi:hypothetical protein